MSTVIHVVLCLNFLLILPPQLLIHSGTINKLQDLVGISRFRDCALREELSLEFQ